MFPAPPDLPRHRATPPAPCLLPGNAMNWTGGKRTSVKVKLDLQKQRDYFNRQRLRRYRQFSTPSVASLHRSSSSTSGFAEPTTSDRIHERLNTLGASSIPPQSVSHGRHDDKTPRSRSLHDCVDEFARNHQSSHHHYRDVPHTDKKRRGSEHHDDGMLNSGAPSFGVETFDDDELLEEMSESSRKKSRRVHGDSGGNRVEKSQAERNVERSMDIVMLERDMLVPVNRKRRLLEELDWASIGPHTDERCPKTARKSYDELWTSSPQKEKIATRKIVLCTYQTSDDERLVDNRPSRRRHSIAEHVEREDGPHTAENSTACSSSSDHDSGRHRLASPTSLAYLTLPIGSDSGTSLGWRRFLGDEMDETNAVEGESDDDGPDAVASYEGRSPPVPVSGRSIVLSSTSRPPSSPESDRAPTGIIGSPSVLTVGASTAAWGRFVLSDGGSVESPDKEGRSEMAICTPDRLEEPDDQDVKSSIIAQDSLSSLRTLSPATFNRTRRTTEPNVGRATTADFTKSLSCRTVSEEGELCNKDQHDEANVVTEERWSLSPQLSPQLSPLKVGRAEQEVEDAVQGLCWEKDVSGDGGGSLEAEPEAVVPVLGEDCGAVASVSFPQTQATEIGEELEQQSLGEAEPTTVVELHVGSAVLATRLETPLPLPSDLASALVPLEETVWRPVSPGRGPMERTGEMSSPGEDEVVLVTVNEES